MCFFTFLFFHLFTFHFLSVLDHTGTFAHEFFRAVKAVCHNVFLTVCLGQNADYLSMGNAFLVNHKDLVLVLQLNSSGRGDYKSVFVCDRQDDVAARTGMKDMVRIGKDGTELDRTCIPVNHAACRFHLTLHLKPKMVGRKIKENPFDKTQFRKWRVSG